METISNEKKAREICGCGNCYHNLKGSECLKDNGILCCLKPCLRNTLQAMRWKDEQHAQEKQKLIDEACKWLFVNDSYAIPTNVQVDRLREHLNKIKG